MNTYKPLNLQFFAEGDTAGGGAATEAPTFEINGQKMTADQIAESYKKLQGEFTKVTQSNSDLKKQVESVKEWLEFDKGLEVLEKESGQSVRSQVGTMIQSYMTAVKQGKSPTIQQQQQMDKAIDQAEKKGDDETVKKLEQLQSVVMEQEFEKAVDAIERGAQDDEIDFNRDEFLSFADEWLDDMGIGEDDDFDLKLLQKAYQAYEAQKLKEQTRRGNIPPLQTSGGSSSPSNTQKQDKMGGIKGAAAKATAFLSGSRF